MTPPYVPPYTVTDRAMQLMVDISAALERYRIILEGADGVRLRKINHVRTIRGTTAIEGNTLTERQITAILAGKRVVGSPREIDEVRGAHRAYSTLESLNPYSIEDLLKAHSLMAEGLVDAPGSWRTCNVGVLGANGEVCHMAPPWQRVPALMEDLFDWLTGAEAPMLVKSCVFHYEFEFIHPFSDGNGRTGRLWQTALLGSWRNEFYGAPVENIVWAHQREYYNAIRESGVKGDCAPFIDFMLDKILRTLRAKGEAYEAGAPKKSLKGNQKSSQKSNQKSSQKILAILKSMPDATLSELSNAMGLSLAGVKKNVRKLRDANLIRRIGPDKGGHWEVM